jgi:hypothetical protein
MTNNWWDHSYTRDNGGRWRYAADKTFVPGAKDLHAKDIWKPHSLGTEWVEFPALITRTPHYKWASQWWATTEEQPPPSRPGNAIISADEWHDQQNKIIGLSAPELAPHAMINTNQLAHMLGIAPRTASSYLARGYLPKATINIEHHPLWSVPVIVRTLRKQQPVAAPKAKRSNKGNTIREYPAELSRLIRELGLDEPDQYELDNE